MHDPFQKSDAISQIVESKKGKEKKNVINDANCCTAK